MENKYFNDPYLNDNNAAVIEGPHTGYIYYYWIQKYFSDEVYSEHGIRLLAKKDAINRGNIGEIYTDRLTQEEIAVLIANNLIRIDKGDCICNSPVFSSEQFCKLRALTEIQDTEIVKELSGLIENIFETIRLNLHSKVPKRLENQIDQRISCDINDHINVITGHVVDDLISRGILRKPDTEKPFTDGVFCVEGEYVNP